jgi:hypothetical protein
MAKYLTEDDFETPAEFEGYLWGLFAKRLNPSVNHDFAAKVFKGFFNYCESVQGMIEAKSMVDLADEILAGEQKAGGSLH